MRAPQKKEFKQITSKIFTGCLPSELIFTGCLPSELIFTGCLPSELSR